MPSGTSRGCHQLSPTLLLNAVFQLTYNAPKAYLYEMHGIADGAGIDVEIIQNINMLPLPETTRAASTIMGAGGNSTPRAQERPDHCLSSPQ